MPRLTASTRRVATRTVSRLLACDLIIHVGDFVQGSVYHTIFGAEIASDAYKWVGYDVAVLGNHEFNQGPSDVYEVVQNNPNTTWIASNVHFEGAPEGFSIAPFVDAFDVCWVSALTTATNVISNPGPNVTITDEVDALNKAIAACSQNQNVIAINHVGFEKDVHMCEIIAELDVVIGGHSHTNLDNAQYPHSLFVRTDQCVGSSQRVAELSGHAYMPMDARVPLSHNVSTQLAMYTERLDNSIKQTIAVASEPIDGSRESCRSQECQMGNLVCDALLAHAGPQQGAQVCIQNGGGLRASVDEGEIIIKEVLTVLPFGNVHVVVSVPGSAIVAALENGFLALSNDEIAGRFPQVGGMKVVVDDSQPEGERVVSVTIDEEPIEMGKEYKLVTNSFVASGGDGYDWSAATESELSGLGLDALTQRYLGNNSPYTPFTDGRIVKVGT
ncbi:5'-Nucleotidase [Gracilaria domingensis]|nr:5'-Nucleotidase [Gracilaria domingensis]